jgi:hypothetical protein
MGMSFDQRLVSLHIARTLSHTQLSHQAHQEQMNIQYSPTSTQTHHQPLHHTRHQGMHALAECVKAIKGMMGKSRSLQAAQDLQCIVDATQAHVQANPHKFNKTTTRTIFATRNGF